MNVTENKEIFYNLIFTIDNFGVSRVFSPWVARQASVGIGEHRWAKIRKFFLPLFWPFVQSRLQSANFGSLSSVGGGPGATLGQKMGVQGCLWRFACFPSFPYYFLLYYFK